MSAQQAILIDIDAAAELLAITPRRLKKLALAGQVPCVDLGDGELRFSPDKLREWVQRPQVAGEVAAP